MTKPETTVISATAFLRAMRMGAHVFIHTHIEGDVDFGNTVVHSLMLNHVTFGGEVRGYITVNELWIDSSNCHYWSNIAPLTYVAGLIKDMAHA